MTQPSLCTANKKYAPHSVTDTDIWPLCPSLQNWGIWMWPQESFSSTQCSRKLQQITWSQNQRLNQFTILVLVQSSHFTNAKTEAQKEKVICPRSYSKTMGKLRLLCTHKSTSLYISKQKTQLIWNITRIWKKIQNFTTTMKSQHTSSGT